MRLGQLLAQRGDTLVYGGGSYGLMGDVAQAAHLNGGRVVGIIPKMLLSIEFAFRNADELIVTEDMRERKASMESRADAFIALPGGIGTLEEIFEIMTLRALNATAKPLILVNVRGFYDPLVTLIQKMREEKFVRREIADIFALVPDAQTALDTIDRLI